MDRCRDANVSRYPQDRMPADFTGKAIMVTGAAAGIGRAAALEFATRGGSVALIDRNAEAGQDAAAEILRRGGVACFLHADVSSRPDSERCVAVVRERFGGIDVLVNNAGIQRYGTAADTPDEIWDEVMDVNLRGPFLMSRAAIPAMIARGGGAIIMVGSVQSLGAVGNSAAYVTSKHAVLGLARSIAVDFARDGIRCHCVCPAAIDTPMLQFGISQAADPARARETCENLHLFRRLGAPEEVAHVIGFLAGSDSSFMTGHPVLVDGGALTPIGGSSFLESGTGSRK
ncbi:MAG TPA: SDR family oxidoreductase [Bryobacteraceae bacterium]|nr:SDR family oxidoreductase [Bryobacteraceae bacterium]